MNALFFLCLSISGSKTCVSFINIGLDISVQQILPALVQPASYASPRWPLREAIIPFRTIKDPTT